MRVSLAFCSDEKAHCLGLQVNKLFQSKLVEEMWRICGAGEVHLTLNDIEVNELLLAADGELEQLCLLARVVF